MTETIKAMVEALIPFLLIVESSNGKDPKAFERGHHAAGPLQITKICVEEVNRRTGSKWKWPDDCFDLENSRTICLAYFDLVAPEWVSMKDLALIWRYGPAGAKRGDPKGYWKKIEAARLKASWKGQ